MKFTSQFGDGVDVWAPGVDVLSAQYQGTYKQGSATDWASNFKPMKGTSMASPVIAGVVAQLLRINSKLTLKQIKDVLKCDEFTKTIPMLPSSAMDITHGFDFFVIGQTGPDGKAFQLSCHNLPIAAEGNCQPISDALDPTLDFFNKPTLTGSLSRGDIRYVKVKLTRPAMGLFRMTAHHQNATVFICDFFSDRSAASVNCPHRRGTE